VERPFDLARERFVALSGRGAGDELAVPRVHLRQIGEAALRERPQQVQRRSGLVVPLEEPLGIRYAGFRPRLVRMDDVPAEGRQLDAVHDLGLGRARLGELAGDTADLHDRQRGAVRQHRRHLQEHLQLLADPDRGDVAERLDAVAGVQQEGAALCNLAERGPERARFPGEDERRQAAQPLHDRGEGVVVRPGRLLARGNSAPRGRSPVALADRHSGQCMRRPF
jgi:hypothetical protein